MAGHRAAILFYLNTRIDEVEKNLNARIDEVERTLNARIDEVEKTLNTRVDEVKEELNTRIKEVETSLNEKIFATERLLLDEMERNYKHFEAKYEKLETQSEELCQYYRIVKLESDNTTIVLRLIDDLSKQNEELKKRVTAIERKIA